MFKIFRKSLNLAHSNKIPERGERNISVVFRKQILRFEAVLQIKLDARGYSFVFHLASMPGSPPIKIPIERNLNVVNLDWIQEFDQEVVAQSLK